MSIDAKTVKVLREKTGAGMMDCKRALVETKGNLEKAVEALRTAGIAKAEKKGSRYAQEGLIYSYIHILLYSYIQIFIDYYISIFLNLLTFNSEQ